ncbi:hypothetical protein [Micromonospora sp. IBHARD004]|uniref:hypothetical protein n=1 Tax=Micromonospora sp. IBHARD004 TaxID=3457764 RepID=UPI004059E60D
MTEPRWTRLQSAAPALVAAFGHRGVVRVEYVSAFPRPEVWVWLGTSTDQEREALKGGPELVGQVLRVLDLKSDEGIAVEGVTVQSEETVSRDYAGSWFYALR